ncbi:copper resistance D family protein [Planococcus sp. FY231025]|uniref:copper resistance D family protein n=1 Tax=Planococcus sp. FY231025 TaxID=3455699 RepID=UPI003F91DE4B
MIWFTVISDILLYLAFAFAAGAIALKFVPESHKPVLAESRLLLVASVAGIAVFSAAPVIELALFLENGEGFFKSFAGTLLDYRVGNGWVITVLFSVLLGVTLYYNGSKQMAAGYAGLLILAVGFYSHVSTVNLWGGFVSHSIHFLALSLWGGILLHVAWFAKATPNWGRFLDWFTPFAFGCVGILLASGVVIMLFFVDLADYTSSWALPYGQWLLLKHLSILPLLAAAMANGLLNKRRLYERAWLRSESLLLLLTLALTAFMSKEAPPHNINETFRSEGAAPLLEGLKGPQYYPIEAAFAVSVNGLLLLMVSMVCLGLIILGFKRNLSGWFSVLLGIGFIFSAYAGLMMNTVF